jgi:hypothetical protein
MHFPITNFQLAHLSRRNYNLPSIWHIYTIIWRKAHSKELTLNVSWVWHIFLVEDFFSFHDVKSCYINFKYLLQYYKHLFMKKGSLFILFCLYLWDPPNWVTSDHILGLSWRGGGCISLVSWCLVLQCRSFWILNYFFIEN